MSIRNSEPENLDAASALALAEKAQQSTRAAVQPKSWLIFLIWGLAYLVGFGAMWLARDSFPKVLAELIMFACIIAALAATVALTVPLTRGLRGERAAASRNYGISWGIAAVAITAFSIGFGSRSEGWDATAQVISAFAMAIIGVMYLFGGTLYCARAFFALGVWFVVVAMVTALVPATFALGMTTVCGAGGLLIAALITWLASMRGTRHAR